MKFPENANVKGYEYKDNSVSALIINAWSQAAIKAGLETGIFVDINFEFFPNNYPYISRIFFTVLDQEAEDETILKRILKLKAFL